MGFSYLSEVKIIIRGLYVYIVSFSGTVYWRVWALSPLLAHLLILLVCFVLVKCGCWPSWHHWRIGNLSLRARMDIKRVVEENWEELLQCVKDLIDTKLEDGKKIFMTKAPAMIALPLNVKLKPFKAGLTSLKKLRIVRKEPLKLSRP